MTTKRTPKKGAGRPAPKPKPENKQRVTLLTGRERLAAVDGGIVDDSIPEAKWRDRLKMEARHEFNLDAIMAAMRRPVADARGLGVPGYRGPVILPRLEPKEIREQAKNTCAMIGALIDRLEHLDQELEAHADTTLWRSHKELCFCVRQRVTPDLRRLCAALDLGAQEVHSKPGVKRTPWQAAREAMTLALKAHSTPKMSAKSAALLAPELLDLCGLESPRKQRGT